MSQGRKVEFDFIHDKVKVQINIKVKVCGEELAVIIMIVSFEKLRYN